MEEWFREFFSIATRFHTYKYAFWTNIKKMYGQIMINPLHRKLQKILWKASKDVSIKVFEVNAIMYGTVSTSFLGMCRY